MNIMKSFRKFVQPVCPDVLPEGRHVAIVEGASFFNPYMGLDEDEVARRKAENGYDDCNVSLSVTFANESGRISRRFWLNGYYRWRKVQQRKAEMVSNFLFPVLNLSKAAKKAALVDPKAMEALFTKHFSSSDEKEGFLVMNYNGATVRCIDPVATEKCYAPLNKCLGAAKVVLPEAATEEEFMQAVCEALKGRKVGIVVEDDLDYGLEVTKFFTPE